MPPADSQNPALSGRLTEFRHDVFDHESLPRARSEHILPGLKDELGRGVAGVPLLQGVGQLVADGRVQRLQPRLHQRQPGVDPRVDGHRVRQRIPALHLGAQQKRLTKSSHQQHFVQKHKEL